MSGFANTLFEFGTQTRTNDPIVGRLLYVDDMHSLHYFGGSTCCDSHEVQWRFVKTSLLETNYCSIQTSFELGLVFCSVHRINSKHIR